MRLAGSMPAVAQIRFLKKAAPPPDYCHRSSGAVPGETITENKDDPHL
jgi:hypothetical protein